MATATAEASESSDTEEDVDEEVHLPDPDFDRAEHMAEEVEKGKLAVMNTGLGIFLASVAAVIEPLFGLSWKAGWIVLGLGLAGLRVFYRLGGVTSHDWGAKEWLGAYFTLFFTFLAFWYVFSNAPFA